MARSVDLVEALSSVEDLPAEQVAGAQTAAALMAMNTTWYPFTELADDPEIEHVAAGLRMQAFATHGGVGPERFELYCLAAAVVGKCHKCIASHVAELRKAGRSTEEIAAVGRIAATVSGVATVLETMADSWAASPPVATSPESTVTKSMRRSTAPTSSGRRSAYVRTVARSTGQNA